MFHAQEHLFLSEHRLHFATIKLFRCNDDLVYLFLLIQITLNHLKTLIENK